MLTNKRIGNWAWTLTAEEGMAALVVGRALREGTAVDSGLKRLYATMMKKQQKLVARRPKTSEVAG